MHACYTIYICIIGWYNLFQNHRWCKKDEPKKVQVAEWLKSVKSLWGQEEKIYQQGCVELQYTKQVK